MLRRVACWQARRTRRRRGEATSTRARPTAQRHPKARRRRRWEACCCHCCRRPSTRATATAPRGFEALTPSGLVWSQQHPRRCQYVNFSTRNSCFTSTNVQIVTVASLPATAQLRGCALTKALVRILKASYTSSSRPRCALTKALAAR